MFAKACLPICAFAALTFLARSATDEKDVPDEVHEIRTALRLNPIQTAKLLERYAQLTKTELELKADIRASAPMEPRLPEYRDRLQNIQAEIDTIKKTLIALEGEKQNWPSNSRST